MSSLSDEVPLLDLGEHRLRDLPAPERLYQLGHAVFPPLRSLYGSNLPTPDTPFIGREEEFANLSSLLAEIDTRLLSLVGRAARERPGSLYGR